MEINANTIKHPQTGDVYCANTYSLSAIESGSRPAEVAPEKSVNLAEGLRCVHVCMCACNPTFRIGFRVSHFRDVCIPGFRLFCSPWREDTDVYVLGRDGWNRFADLQIDQYFGKLREKADIYHIYKYLFYEKDIFFLFYSVSVQCDSVILGMMVIACPFTAYHLEKWWFTKICATTSQIFSRGHSYHVPADDPWRRATFALTAQTGEKCKLNDRDTPGTSEMGAWKPSEPPARFPVECFRWTVILHSAREFSPRQAFRLLPFSSPFTFARIPILHFATFANPFLFPWHRRCLPLCKPFHFLAVSRRQPHQTCQMKMEGGIA